VEEFGASCRREGIEALAEGLLHLLEGHVTTLVPPGDSSSHGPSMVRERFSKDPKCSVLLMSVLAGQRHSSASDQQG
jgi:hypothetical protein